MNASYNNLIEIVRRYVKVFASEGYSLSEAETFASFLSGVRDLPIASLFDTFSCNAFECVAAAAGLAVLLDAETASMMTSLFGCPDKSVTPQALCALVFGTDSISDCCALFAANSVLSRFFDGTAPVYNARMTLKPCIHEFMMTGEVTAKYISRLDTKGNYDCDAYAQKTAASVVSALRHYSGEISSLINISGIAGSGRRTVLRLASAECGMDFALLQCRDAVKADAGEISTILALMGVYPALITDDINDENACKGLIAALMDEIGTVVVLSPNPLPNDITDADLVSVSVPLPSVAEQSMIWARKSEAYRVADDVDFREIAMEFSLPPGEIDRAFRFAELNRRGDELLTSADIKKGCYASVGSYMGNRAVKVNCAFSWDDLVLPAHSKKLLRTACDYVRYGCTVYEKWNFGVKLPYGRGASMIFTGPPGTGKTMAAQVIAHELEMELYKVNLASIVSKYIGETEKNLNDIFDRAKKSRVVLFFDEADVLFGKRTEVKDSNDKYSNMEAAFLLQKIEEYNGIAILATNFVQNFDEAFKRRMKFLVEFPFPGKEQRAEIWKKVFPPQAPVGQLDYEYLVENFEISGSNIKNIAVHSAFLAASGGDSKIEMKHIVAALRNEFAKSGKSFTKAEAGEYFYYLDD